MKSKLTPEQKLALLNSPVVALLKKRNEVMTALRDCSQATGSTKLRRATTRVYMSPAARVHYREGDSNEQYLRRYYDYLDKCGHECLDVATALTGVGYFDLNDWLRKVITTEQSMIDASEAEARIPQTNYARGTVAKYVARHEGCNT
jgi:hypothetical protein